jgi:uncharacterized membrane protein YeaQ/YmgE (transglycosylase-associated protein family)
MIGAAILGIVAGYLARAILPGKQEMGFFATALLGIVGALAGFFIFTELLGIGDTEIFDLGGLIGAVIGSIIVLLLYERFVRRESEREPATAASREARMQERRERRRGRDQDREQRPAQ